MSLFPPRKSKWAKGKFQIGVFVRTPDGGKLEICMDRVAPEYAQKIIDATMDAATRDENGEKKPARQKAEDGARKLLLEQKDKN